MTIPAYKVELSDGERFKEGLRRVDRPKFWRYVTDVYAADAIGKYARRVPRHWSSESKALFYRRGKPGDAIFFGGSAGVLYVERGTRPHTIRPRHAKALQWRTEGRGPVSSAHAVAVRASGEPGALHPSQFQYAMVVQHPGTKARFFVLNTLTASWTLFLRKRLPFLVDEEVKRMGAGA